MRSNFILAHHVARKNAIQAILEAPDGYAVSIKPKNRSLEQNAKLHALIQEIAQKIEWVGKKQEVETWKRLLTAAWLRARGEPVEMLPAIDGHGVDIVFRRTSDLTVPEMIELIEYIQAWAVEQGIDVL
jgi:hypothetical protein